jgi:hypothetical protein
MRLEFKIMKRLTSPEALAFVVPTVAMIAIVLLSALSSSLINPGQNVYSNLEPVQRAAAKSF